MNQGLEALEYLKENHRLPDEAITRGCVEDIEKELKALEAIRSKGINWREFKLCKTLEQYNEPIILYGLLDVKPYTEEEYNLLKEVFQEHE